MKMTPEHYEELEQAIRRVQSENPKATAQSYEERNLSPMRYRWDLYAKARYDGYLKLGDGAGKSGIPFYAYLNDSHVDTALRRIVGA